MNKERLWTMARLLFAVAQFFTCVSDFSERAIELNAVLG
ncbi:Indolepyruvate ferredoxin oxidoreductase2C [gamma proteobacterium IMCC2047]|nr:Indolepyruvate ferredoxin oxidoreductase2C [gamma proteobacterium IMCC2047]